MLSERAIAAQCNRLGCLPSGQVEGDRENLLAELGTALRRCDTLEHARLTVDTLMERARFLPVPAEVYTAIEETRAALRPAAPVRGFCGECANTGYVTTRWLITWQDARISSRERISQAQYESLRGQVSGVGIQDVYEGAAPCTACERGRRILVAQAQREVEAEAKDARRAKRRDSKMASAGDVVEGLVG